MATGEDKLVGVVITHDHTHAGVEEEFLPPEVLYEDLIARVRKYHPSDDLSLIEKAYTKASKAHAGQKRKSGELYIVHPLNVAIILADLEMDKETITAGILHDVLEDTYVDDEMMRAEFGEEVTSLVEGVTKLEQIPLQGAQSIADTKLEMQAENLRKMFLAMAKDIRVIMIKLADRLHNMRTLKYQSPESQVRIARETLDIYCPIAQRLGISRIKVELDDLSLKYLEPESYAELEKALDANKLERENHIAEIVQEVSEHIRKAGIQAQVTGRVKHLFSIYKKMRNQNKTLDQIYDVFAVRIIVDSVMDCYAALGVIHEMYKPIPGRFKDYIAMPKANMYQSLHTTLIGADGRPFEIQIRTFEMHKAAEYGIAAHWKYKEASGASQAVHGEEEKLTWLRQILEWQQDMSDNREFLNLLKNDLDLFADSVYCFTPSGEVKNLPAGSCPVDFAYLIHSAVGNKMIGARVNGKLVPIDYRIKNGDRIEILTSANTKGPSRDWLGIVKSTQAKTKINQWFKNESKDDNTARGKDLVAGYAKSHGFDLSQISTPDYQQEVQNKYCYKDWDSILAAVGRGALKEGQIVNKLKELYDRDHPRVLTNEEVMTQVAEANMNAASRHLETKTRGGIIVKGMTDLSVRYSKCCSPVPGDEIVGFVTRGRGISIHRTDCVNILSLPEMDRVRLIDAQWQAPISTGDQKYVTEIKIYANDRSGLLADISRVLTEKNINIIAMNTRTNKQGVATLQTSFEIHGREELDHIAEKIRAIDGVIDIERSAG
ncbi:MAG: bifunctional (p)ppGpp synthetase/guanosine-3',5'-bis(diphosphate) 3'-pyrophosphohydrolase [Lachnospiraceae bacterium]|nr:bifunctional (p)ppGpp synthetase/guanosine-3',5'-bis(diphosphate) 3'-pyrophosphohydrolase [Lachnospiraceae bacterium]